MLVLQGRKLSESVPPKVAIAGGLYSHMYKAHDNTRCLDSQPTTTELMSSAGSKLGLLRQQGIVTAVGT